MDICCTDKDRLTVVDVDELSRRSDLDQIGLLQGDQSASDTQGDDICETTHVVDKHVLVVAVVGVLSVGGDVHLVAGIDLDLRFRTSRESH